MVSFQSIVLIIAVLILLIILIVIGSALYSAKKSKWPPSTPECPDYWVIDGSGNNANCINIKDLGNCNPINGDKHLTINFNNPPFTDNCSKYNWANKCKIAWDGITYGVPNPCTT